MTLWDPEACPTGPGASNGRIRPLASRVSPPPSSLALAGLCTQLLRDAKAATLNSRRGHGPLGTFHMQCWPAGAALQSIRKAPARSSPASQWQADHAQQGGSTDGAAAAGQDAGPSCGGFCASAAAAATAQLCPSPEPPCATDPGRHALFCQSHTGLSPNTTAGWLRQQGCLDQCHAFLFTGCIICFSLPAFVKLYYS